MVTIEFSLFLRERVDMTVENLRNSGYKIRILHYRNSKNNIILPKGGHTRVIIDSPDGSHFEGEAKCSNQDNYNKKLGVRIAIGRALYGNLSA